MAKLTKTVVDKLKVPSAGQGFVWDSELRGFGVRVVPSGLKTFIIQYRNDAEKSRRMTIGRYPLVTVDQARQVAKIKLGAVAAGNDPAKQDKVDGLTVDDVCDWYMREAEAGRILGRRNRPIKLSTLKMDRSRIETHIRPLIGDRRVSTLRVVDIETMQAEIVAGHTGKSAPAVEAVLRQADPEWRAEPCRPFRAY